MYFSILYFSLSFNLNFGVSGITVTLDDAAFAWKAL